MCTLPNCIDFSAYSLSLEELRQSLACLNTIAEEYNLPVGVLTVYPLCAVKNVRQYFMTAGRRCSAGVTVAVISAQGEVRACTHIAETTGNIYEESLQDLWKKMEPWRDGSLLPSACKSCKALAICGGGCRAEAKVIKGSFDAEDPLTSIADIDFAVEEYRLFVAETRRETQLPLSLQVNPELRWRIEAFGSVCFLRNKCAGFLNADSTQLIFSELIGRVILTSELLSIIPEKFLKELYRKEILISNEVV